MRKTHPQAKLGLSHVSRVGLEPTPDTEVRRSNVCVNEISVLLTTPPRRPPKADFNGQIGQTIYMHMSHLVRKPTTCICENQDADQLWGDCEADLISAFVFATQIVQFLLYLTPKFQASSSFLCLYKSVCVRPVRKPHCWFSHEAAHM